MQKVARDGLLVRLRSAVKDSKDELVVRRLGAKQAGTRRAEACICRRFGKLFDVSVGAERMKICTQTKRETKRLCGSKCLGQRQKTK